MNSDKNISNWGEKKLRIEFMKIEAIK